MASFVCRINSSMLCPCAVAVAPACPAMPPPGPQGPGPRARGAPPRPGPARRLLAALNPEGDFGLDGRGELARLNERQLLLAVADERGRRAGCPFGHPLPRPLGLPGDLRLLRELLGALHPTLGPPRRVPQAN